MRTTGRGLAAAAALALLMVLTGPAATASAGDEHDPGRPATSSTGAPVPLDGVLSPGPLPGEERTAEQLAAEVDQLQQQVEQQQASVLAEQGRLASAEAAAAQTLADYQQAQREADEARRTALEQARRLAVAKAQTEQARARLHTYVGDLYRQGMRTERMSVYSSLLGTRGPDAFLNGLSLAERVGAKRGGEMVQLAEAERLQQQAEQRAAAAELAAQESSHAAEAAKRLADAVVDEATRSVLASTETLLRTQGAAAAAAQEEAARRELMARAEAIAAQRTAIPYAAIEGSLVPRPSADCVGRDIQGYPNGRLPTAALCPLWGTNGQMLRADAAAAFNEMSRAYALVFGAPICVTDSYRTYDEQVAVRAAKPELAAPPGTSNHGWALAVDLCDGVQSFGTPTHEWLRSNSLRYGWFLPAWAMPGGSKPEPWHWEFAG